MSLSSKWAAGKPVRAGLALKGAYLNRYVTDEQHSHRPIFDATLRAAASWLFFRVARSARMDQIWALRSRIEKQPTDLRRHHHYMRDGTLLHRLIYIQRSSQLHIGRALENGLHVKKIRIRIDRVVIPVAKIQSIVIHHRTLIVIS